MITLTKRGAWLTAAILGVLAFTATTAQASITPVNARVSASATNTEIGFAGASVRCQLSTATGTINASGSAFSGNLRFPRSTCIESLFASSVRVRCVDPSSFTLRSNTSQRGSLASGTLLLDANFDCSVTFEIIDCVLSVRGPQGPFNATSVAWVFNQATQHLTILATTVSVVRLRGMGLCPPSGTGSFEADYIVSGTRLTIS